MASRARAAGPLFGASPNDAGWQAAIHAVVLRLGRHLGFQAFNVDSRTENTPTPSWTPATIFLVTDHLHHLLVKNYMRRDKAIGTDDEKFERAVYRLHAAIFQAYREWCSHVSLPARLPQLEYEAMCQSRGHILEWEYLLEELSLYFLIYSEGANLRHMPEGLWFLFWIVRNSQNRIAQVTGFPADHPRSANVAAHSEMHKSVIRKQLHLRNRYQKEISRLRTDLNVKPDGDYKSDRELADIRRIAASKVAPLFGGATLEVDLLADMVAYGDSGSFCDRIVEPVFNYLAVQVDELGTKGRDIQWRIAYDDCNESLCSKAQVHKVLKTLGVTIDVRKRVIRMDKDPYETLLSVGEKRVSILTDDGKNKPVPVGPTATLGWGWQDARNWWAQAVFGKTFVERRSWLTIGRAFYRVWLFLVLEFQAMAVIMWGWDTKYRYYWLSSLAATHATAGLLYEVAGAWTQRSTLKGVRLLGHPFWRRYARAILERLIVMAVLALAFVAQWLDFIRGVTLWWYVAGGYAALVVAHEVVTQRDGYTVSLSHSVAATFRSWGLYPLAWLFEFVGASSYRPPPEHHLFRPSNLKTGWLTFLSNMTFWVLVIAAKITFDWFAVMQTMKTSVIALYQADWLGIIGWTLVTSPDPNIPPRWVSTQTSFNLDIILCIGRVLPGFLVVMNDMQVFYYLFGAGLGVLKGLLQLDLGAITSFQELVVSFHKAPLLWWRRGMSPEGRHNIATEVSRGAAGTASAEVAASNVNVAMSDSYQQRKSGRKSSGSITETLKDIDEGGDALRGNNLPAWLAYSDVWNGIVDDLRSVDLISNSEAKNLRFVHIVVDETTEIIPGMRPVMLPVFFYGGQVSRALEAPSVDADPSHGFVLSEIRSLLLFILTQTGIITPSQAAALAAFRPLSRPSSLEHRAKRSRGVDLLLEFLVTMKAIMAPAEDRNAELARRDALVGMREVLMALLAIVEFEISCFPNYLKLFQAKSPATVAAVSKVVEELKTSRLDDGGWREFWGEVGALEAMYAEAEPSTARANVAKVVDHLHKMLTISARGAQPRGEEARRVLSFFAASLKNPTLGGPGGSSSGRQTAAAAGPPAIEDMLSWNVLTPHYEEDVFYALDGRAEAQRLGLGAQSAAASSSSSLPSDLVTENEDGVTVMAWLRSNYPLEWNNLIERLTPLLESAGVDGKLIDETDFEDGGPLAAARHELLAWASYRGQLLARTVRGMMSYETSLRLLARLENPNTGSGMNSSSTTTTTTTTPSAAVGPIRYNSAIDDLIRSKFTYIVAAQKYGDARKSNTVKGRWMAKSIETLLLRHLGLRVAFLDTTLSKAAGRRVQHAVLVRGRGGSSPGDAMSTEELYRIRLPINYAERGGHGIILGEGKPENQNAAIIFCFGEVIQAIDMNQDNYLAEALKIRNLIAEFEAPSLTEERAAKASKAAGLSLRRRAREVGPDAVAIPSSSSSLASGVAATRMASHANTRNTNKHTPNYAYERPFPDVNASPVVLVGCREWIFSQDSGALASFAAATEFTFGSIVQRVMTWPGAVRFHYGHPDLWNKLFIMTRGGLSKATRGFHISEDVFAGYNHTLRGGRVKFKEYISVGKGRDMGFDSINSFESKISGGNGEQVMSRDVYRLGTSFDFFRLLSFYHSGPGFFINSYLVLLSVYANVWMLVMLALTGTQTLPDPNNPLATVSTLTGQSTSVSVQQLVQIGMFSIVTYAAELILELGILKAAATLLLQLLQGSLAFFIFRTRTTAYYFLSDVKYGGAKYVSTGRGYQLKHTSFVKVYSNYARSHLYFAAELLVLLILLALVGPDQYALTTWSAWMVCVSLFWAPFWFNPGSFLLEKTTDDFEAWTLWMGDVVDPDTKTTWASWNKAELVKPRNDGGRQTNPVATAARGVLGALPTAVLTIGAISDLGDSRWNRWLVFGVMTGVFWFSIVFLMVAYRLLAVMAGRLRVWRLVRTVTVVSLLGFYIASIIVVPSPSTFSSGLRNLVLVVFANVSAAVATTQFLLYLFPRLPVARRLVDAGYRALDYIIGYFLFFFLFILSFLQVFNTVQGALLFNVKFSRRLSEARGEAAGDRVTSHVRRATQRIGDALKRELDRRVAGHGQGDGTPRDPEKVV